MAERDLREDIRAQIQEFDSIYHNPDNTRCWTYLGNDCVRLDIHIRRDSSRFFDKGYDPNNYGFSNTGELKKEINRIMAEEEIAHQKPRAWSSLPALF